ncbi:Inner membrane protein YohK [bioreactor metagenome]|uniref:Inner membrane protein YohK n=1 Tax=bioreactor metagenome TaxID=1076179 RepID=A0A644YTC6_9ZZZZ|nr:LrgB family protein [Candidatus Metalachnospira sp.]
MLENLYSGLFSTAFFGIALTLLAFKIGMVINQKTKKIIFNPLLIAIIIVIAFLAFTGISYDTYYVGGSMIQFLLTPATIALAVPLYRQLEVLKKNLKAIILAIFSGSIACAITMFLLAKAFNMPNEIYYGLTSKSVTLAIALGITSELGGIAGVTCVAVVVSGIIGAAFVTVFSKIFKITNPIALGLSVGTASHAIGTSRAIQLDELVGAMGSLSIVIAGVLTVVIAPIMAGLY